MIIAVYEFEENLTKCQRDVVHKVCKEMGMFFKISRLDNRRCVSVYKNKKVDSTKEENLTTLTFSEDTKVVLRDLFTRYPPGDEEVIEKPDEKLSGKTRKRVQKDPLFCRPSMKKSEIERRVEEHSSRLENIPDLKQITRERSKLPIASFRDVITSMIESHQVVLISGETGCGKTTQVPQFLLEHMWSKGEPCKIVCTQPRRLSAISVAERISHERGENIGDNVGYKIRLESKGGKNSSIVFCTNGILLRLLISAGVGSSKAEVSHIPRKGSFLEITHIIMDEIHERDCNSDFMLAILRDMLPLCPHLRLVLMSATIDSERFSEYFGGCPIIQVPGFTYPVKPYYLEDILYFLKSAEQNHPSCISGSASIENLEQNHPNCISGSASIENLEQNHPNCISGSASIGNLEMDEAINLALSNDEFDPLVDLLSSEGTLKVINYPHSSTGVTPLMVFAGKGRLGDVCMLLSLGADSRLQANDGSTALEWAERGNQEETAEIIKRHIENVNTNLEKKQKPLKQKPLDEYLASTNPELVNVDLIVQLLRKICVDSKDGAILVFLPGWDDINKTRERLTTDPFFKDSSRFVILSLHSMIPSEEQKKVFRRPPLGCRKIILSTNLAETAVTIDDVVCVIDSGRMKEKSYDPYNNVSTLETSWISKASAKQRQGRAGRCQPGICFHLYSKLRADSMPDFPVPEIKRTSMEELCLQVKLLDPHCRITAFLQKTLDPPVFEAIQNAVIVLQDIGALTADETLTELGERLGSLPVHPLTSRMLLFAILLNCLDPALTLACASAYRDPFVLPMSSSEKKKADLAKLELASLYGGNSDQLAIVAAFDCWRSANKKGQGWRFCSMYFLSPSTMNMLSGMREQLQNELIRNGFIANDVKNCSLNARDPGILHGVLMAGLYPMVGRLRSRLQDKRRYIETAGGDKVRILPRSSNSSLSTLKSDDQPLIIFDEIILGDEGMHIRNCTVIGPLPLLLLATEIAVAPGKDNDSEDDKGSSIEGTNDDKEFNNQPEGGRFEEKILYSPETTVTVIVDRWLSFKLAALDVAQIYCLRERLNAAMLFKLKYHSEVLPPVLSASVYSIACILSHDGLSALSLPSETADSRTSRVDATEIDTSCLDRIEFLKWLTVRRPLHASSSHYRKRRAVSSKG
ncbi:Helicase, C-terminal [Dillenia turbinata]|uniref:RNA helicase n=1 Tax=Dillenia turbinata TaxID=194707 RepID=A0AAN8UWB7_9MAGN